MMLSKVSQQQTSASSKLSFKKKNDTKIIRKTDHRVHEVCGRNSFDGTWTTSLWDFVPFTDLFHTSSLLLGCCFAKSSILNHLLLSVFHYGSHCLKFCLMLYFSRWSDSVSFWPFFMCCGEEVDRSVWFTFILGRNDKNPQ